MVKYISFLAFILTVKSWNWTFGGDFHDNYPTLHDIDESLFMIAKKFPNLASYGTIGNSTSGIPINFLKLSAPGLPSSEKGGILLTASQTALYPINTVQILYLINRLCKNYNVTGSETYILQSTNVWFIPVINVDAYKLLQDNQFQNKTFIKNSRFFNCSNQANNGVNLDKNWDFAWGETKNGSSNDICSQDYRGSYAFSEIETQLVKEFVKYKNITTWIHYEMYGNNYIHPYKAENYKEVKNSISFAYSVFQDAMYVNQVNFGTYKDIYGTYGDGSLIDYAVSQGMFSMEVGLGPKIQNDPKIMYTYIFSQWNAAKFLMETATFYLEAYMGGTVHACSSDPTKCDRKNDFAYIDFEVEIINSGLTIARNIVFEIQFYNSNPGDYTMGLREFLYLEATLKDSSSINNPMQPYQYQINTTNNTISLKSIYNFLPFDDSFITINLQVFKLKDIDLATNSVISYNASIYPEKLDNSMMMVLYDQGTVMVHHNASEWSGNDLIEVNASSLLLFSIMGIALLLIFISIFSMYKIIWIMKQNSKESKDTKPETRSLNNTV